MKTQFSLLVVLGVLLGTYTIHAQELPLVYGEENTGADCPEIYTPTFSELPVVGPLPDPFAWADGRGRIEHKADWRCRRNEIATEVQNYEIGKKPTDHEELTASFENGTLTVTISRNGHALQLQSAINVPTGEGPFPAIIGMGSATGSMPGSIFSSRNIAQISFNFGDVMQHTQSRGNEPINKIYPELEYMGAYSAWSWGVSRLIDGLELVADEAKIDTEHLGVTGCSFAGKMALFAGAFDERIALTIAQESGGGGYTTWRVSETLGNVETLGNTSHAWFTESMFQFSSAVNRLPHDHHELMAMVAPRALLVTGNPGYEWLADESGFVGSVAAKEVYNALEVPDRFGYIIQSGHSHCAVPTSQVPHIEAFVERFLLEADSVNTQVAITPYSTNTANWMPWETPALGNDSSFLGTTGLQSPENNASGLDTVITFTWAEINGADTYYFELSKNGAFQTVLVSDSTSGTEQAVTGLEVGKRYYWRVRVKDNEGSKGPWSYPNQFITSINLPGVPVLGKSKIARPSRPNYFEFTWQAGPWADSYDIVLAKDSTFASPVSSGSTNKASHAVTILRATEGETYFWRVRGKNIAGTGAWSKVAYFYVFAQPDDFEVEVNEDQEVELKWDDNSDIEEGYIIERSYDGGESFTVIDTLDVDVEEYTDLSADLSQATLTYRIRGFEGSNYSDYSDEAMFSTVANELAEDVPSTYSISQNYPNPFNPSTLISYQLPETGVVSLTVFDALGRQVTVLVDGQQAAGMHQVTFDGTGLASGTYVYQLRTPAGTITKMMMLLK